MEYTEIIPENLLKNESINTLLKIYFETINFNVEKPVNILNIDYIMENLDQGSSDSIRSELMKIHMQEIYEILGDMTDKSSIFEKFKEIYDILGVSSDDFKIVSGIDNILSTQYINSSKNIKSKKGNISGFFYVYDLINRAGAQGFSNEDYFEVFEGTLSNPNEPYSYRIETTMAEELYDAAVVPLAHPVGFNYLFSKIVFLLLEDHYNEVVSVELTKFLIKCLKQDSEGNTIVDETNVLDGRFGEYESFYYENGEGRSQKLVVDFKPLAKYAQDENFRGYRLVKGMDGYLTLYTRQDTEIIGYECLDYGSGYGNATFEDSKKEIQSINNTTECNEIDNRSFIGEKLLIEIEEIEIEDDSQGILEIFETNKKILGEDATVISNISFKEYTIMDKYSLNLRFRLRNDLNKNIWYTSNIPLTKKTISADKKFFIKEFFSRKNILDNSRDMNGRVVKEMGNTCEVTYEREYKVNIQVNDDDLVNVMEEGIEDIWARCQNFDNRAWYIGQFIKDPEFQPIIREPIIGLEDNENNPYLIGYNSDVKTNWLDTSNELRGFPNIPENINEIENPHCLAWEGYSTTLVINFRKPLIEFNREPNYIGDFLISDETIDPNLFTNYDGEIEPLSYTFIGYNLVFDNIISDDIVNFNYWTQDSDSITGIEDKMQYKFTLLDDFNLDINNFIMNETIKDEIQIKRYRNGFLLKERGTDGTYR